MRIWLEPDRGCLLDDVVNQTRPIVPSRPMGQPDLEPVRPEIGIEGLFQGCGHGIRKWSLHFRLESMSSFLMEWISYDFFLSS